jgi:hypothetical protein
MMEQIDAFEGDLLRAGCPKGKVALLTKGWRAKVQRKAQRQARDAALERLHAEFFPLLVGHTAARAVGGAILRYETTSWPRDRVSGVPPHDALDAACREVLLHSNRTLGRESLRRRWRR